MNDALTGPPAAAWTTQEAITRAQQGDSAAFEHLYKAHSKHVYSVCLRMLKNTAEGRGLDAAGFLSGFPENRNVPGRISFLGVAAQGDDKHCADALAEKPDCRSSGR
jgi:hypothetical protein